MEVVDGGVYDVVVVVMCSLLLLLSVSYVAVAQPGTWHVTEILSLVSMHL